MALFNFGFHGKGKNLTVDDRLQIRPSCLQFIAFFTTCWGLGTIVLVDAVNAVEALAVTTEPSQTPVCVADLSTVMDQWLQQPSLRSAIVGVALETMTGEPIYHFQADRRLIPASNQKLLTTAAALSTWGSDRQWTTPIQLTYTDRGEPEVWIRGAGDPTITSASLTQVAAIVAQRLKQRGIDRLAGLVGDDRAFEGSNVPGSWEVADTQTGYGARINSLILNENAIPLILWPQNPGEPLRVEWENPGEAPNWPVDNFSVTGEPSAAEFVAVGTIAQSQDQSQEYSHEQSPNALPTVRVEGVLRTGAAPETVSIALPNPGKHFLLRFQAALQQQGIRVDHTRLLEDPRFEESGESVLSELAPTELAPTETIATLTSPPLAELVQVTHYYSQNLYAEVLLRWLGQASAGLKPDVSPTGFRPSTFEDGLEYLRQLLQDWGIDPLQVSIADGSGLSRHNAITPKTIVQVLQFLQQPERSDLGRIYRSSLSEAGVSGNLATRFQNTPLQGKLWGKTGSMTGIAAFSGYLYPDRFAPLTFSILINQSSASYGTLSETIDRVLLDWVQLRDCNQQLKAGSA